jgi:hypothetical protein
LPVFQLTNAGKIFFTIFTALKKTNHLFFKRQPVLGRISKKKAAIRDQAWMFPPPAGGRKGKQIFFK